MNPENGHPYPKFRKGQEVYFFDYDETRIVKGVIKELVAYEKDNLYNLEIESWKYSVYTPLNNGKEMSWTQLYEWQLYPTYHDCIERQITCYKYRIENNSMNFDQKTQGLWLDFQRGKRP
jgi:hypothetical protein